MCLLSYVHELPSMTMTMRFCQCNDMENLSTCEWIHVNMILKSAKLLATHHTLSVPLSTLYDVMQGINITCTSRWLMDIMT